MRSIPLPTCIRFALDIVQELHYKMQAYDPPDEVSRTAEEPNLLEGTTAASRRRRREVSFVGPHGGMSVRIVDNSTVWPLQVYRSTLCWDLLRSHSRW